MGMLKELFGDSDAQELPLGASRDVRLEEPVTKPAALQGEPAMSSRWVRCTKCQVHFQTEATGTIRCAACKDSFAEGSSVVPAPSWHVVQNKQKVGPLSLDQMRQLSVSGRLRPEDMVLQEGTLTWTPAANVSGLFEAKPLPSALMASPSAEVTPSASSNTKLIDCPDCGNSVSKRAGQCPHCGCPIGDTKPQPVVVQAIVPQVSVFEIVFRCVVQAVRDVGYAVGRMDKQNGMIAFKTGMSLFSFGQDISLVVVDMGMTCSIDMTSSYGEITDWGASERIVQKIATRARALLAAEGMQNALQ